METEQLRSDVIKDLEKIVSEVYGIYVTDVEITESGFKIYHEIEGEKLVPISLSYDVASELVDEYYNRQELKTQTIADIMLKMVKKGGHTNLYKMPGAQMEALKVQLNENLIDFNEYVTRARKMSEHDLYGMYIQDLKNIKELVETEMGYGSVLIIPEINVERSVTSLDTVEEYDVKEFYVPEKRFNVAEIDIIPGELLLETTSPFMTFEEEEEELYGDHTDIINRIWKKEQNRKYG